MFLKQIENLDHLNSSIYSLPYAIWINKTRLISKLNWKTKSPTIENLYCIKFNIQHFHSCLSSAIIRIAIALKEIQRIIQLFAGEILKPQNLICYHIHQSKICQSIGSLTYMELFHFFFGAILSVSLWAKQLRVLDSHFTLFFGHCYYCLRLNQLLNFTSNEIQARSSNIQLEIVHCAWTFFSNVEKILFDCFASQLFTQIIHSSNACLMKIWKCNHFVDDIDWLNFAIIEMQTNELRTLNGGIYKFE